MNTFTWIPFYKELAERLLTYRDRQSELIAILQELKDQELPVISLDDKAAKDKTVPLSSIDPFTFFAAFNRKATDQNRQTVLAKIKDRLLVQAAIPNDFDGIPIMHPMMSRFLPWQFEQQGQDLASLWAFAAAVVTRAPEDIPPELFNRCLGIHCVSVTNLTMGMFWMRPDIYLALDKRNRALLDERGVEHEVTDWASYRQFMKDAKLHIPEPPYEFSRTAFTGESDKKYWLFQGTPKYYDVVGALRDGAIKTWEVNQYKAKIHPGDKVIIWVAGESAGCYALATVNDYMKRFTESAAAVSKEDFAADLVAELAWWQVITMAMLDLKTSNVSGILGHPLMQARIQRANNRTPRAAVWAHLQMHTKADCPEVKYAKRYEPLLFSKDDKSVWSIDEKLATEEAPDLVEALQRYRGYTPSQGAVIKRYEYTTFHQSYSYEDFVEGIKPVMSEEVVDTLAYEVKPGIFKVMVQRALADPSHDYALLIDEISRGNVANIFGELITLIEDDKRLGKPNELRARLPYSRDEFVVPKNLYLIGAMNTADRSVEALDTALRRRFTFIAMPPKKELIQQPANLGVDLHKLLGVINARIEKLLDKDHCIGHSYFMDIAKSIDPLNELRHAFATKILPLMEEYFYGDPAKIGMVLGERFVSRKDDETEWAEGDWGMDEFEERHVYTLSDPLMMKAEDFRTVYE